MNNTVRIQAIKAIMIAPLVEQNTEYEKLQRSNHLLSILLNLKGNMVKRQRHILKESLQKASHYEGELNSQTAINCQKQIILNGRNIIKYLDQSVNHIGNYQECLDTPGYNFYMVTLLIKDGNYSIFEGLCLPSFCTPQTAKEGLNAFLTQADKQITVQSVTTDVQYNNYPFTWVFYLTVILLAMMIGLVIYSTLSKTEHRLLKGASVYESVKVFDIKQSDLNVLNGLRALSMICVIYVHYYQIVFEHISNSISMQEIMKEPFLVSQRTFLPSVDIFFFLGGFFLAFTFIRQKPNNMKYPLAILKRALRIWPAYIITMLIFYSILLHLSTGPFQGYQQSLIMQCRHMWRQIIFISNFVQTGEMCMGWGWYLQVDFQIFFVCIIILLIYEQSHHLTSYALTAILIFGSLVFCFTYSQQHYQKLYLGLDFNMLATLTIPSYFTEIYIKPYARWTPYFMGLYLGIFYCQYQQSLKKPQLNNNLSVQLMHYLKNKFDNNKYLRIAFEWSGVAIMAFFTFIIRTVQTGHVLQQIWYSLYLSLSGPFFVIGTIMITFPTVLGCKGSFFRLLLDNKILNFIAKISFCGYLVHLIVLFQYQSSRKYQNYYSFMTDFPVSLGLLVVICFFGFLMTIFVELPFSVWQKELIKNLFNTNGRTQDEEKVNEKIGNGAEVKEIK